MSRADCLQCEGLRWYRPDSLSDLRPCHFCLEAGRPMLPRATPDCARCSGLGMYRLAYSRVMAACPECLTRTVPPPAPDFSWHYQVDAQERVTGSDARALKRLISAQPNRFRATYARPPLFRERRSLRPGLLRGVALGLLVGSSLALLFVRLGAIWGTR